MSRKLLLIVFSFFLLCSFNLAWAKYQVIVPSGSETSLVIQVAVSSEGVVNIKKFYSVSKDFSATISSDIITKVYERSGNSFSIPFKIIKVSKNGRPIDYEVVDLNDGKRIEMYLKNKEGSKLNFEVEYELNRTVYFNESREELMLPLYNNEFLYDFDSIECIVIPPNEKTNFYSADLYSKRIDENKYVLSAVDALIGDKGIYFINLKDKLPVEERLFLFLTLPLGTFISSSAHENADSVGKENNLAIFAGLIGLIVLFVFYIWAWLKVGRDPKKGVEISIYDPPKGFSPAALRYIRKMGYDSGVFTAAIISMASKGYLKIEEKDDEFVLSKISDSEESLSDEEAKLANEIFNHTKKIALVCNDSNYGRFNNCIDMLSESMDEKFGDKYFIKNSLWLLRGLIITALFALITIGITLSSNSLLENFFLVFASIFLSFNAIFLLAVLLILLKGFDFLRLYFQSKKKIYLLGFILMLLFSIPFIYISKDMLLLIFMPEYALLKILFVFSIVINCVFYQLLKAPTIEGRLLLDEIEGYRQYLKVAEKDRINFFAPATASPEKIEKNLSYAVALDVGGEWAEQLTNALKNAALDPHHHN